MNIGPTSVSLGGLAATPLAQSKGKELDRSAEAAAQDAHRLHSEKLAERANGVGQTDGEDHQAEERDADGRRPWEIPDRARPTQSNDSSGGQQGPDPSGQLGRLIDLSG